MSKIEDDFVDVAIIIAIIIASLMTLYFIYHFRKLYIKKRRILTVHLIPSYINSKHWLRINKNASVD